MEMFNTYFVPALLSALAVAVTGVFGYIGAMAKKYVERWLDTKEKKEIAKTAVQAVEQIYKNLHGEEKLVEAMKAASDMLTEKGIAITELELRMLIEAALAGFNDAFNSSPMYQGEDTDYFIPDEEDQIGETTDTNKEVTAEVVIANE